jgi:hypothetical protein
MASTLATLNRTPVRSIFLVVAAPAKRDAIKACLHLVATSGDQDASMPVFLAVATRVKWDVGEAGLPRDHCLRRSVDVIHFPRIISIKNS